MFSCALVGCLALATLNAQSPPQGSASQDDPDADTTMFPHSQTARYWISGQDNIIFQYHPSFPAKYSGAHSFRLVSEHATSNIASLYTGYQLTDTTEIVMHFESAAGGGISDALGLAGFTDLDVVRNPTLGPAPYIARGMIRQIVPLSSQTIEQERNPWYLNTRVPARRLEFRFGKMGLNDFFDINDSGADSHFQFMNWAVDNNGAYDYAADTRGYTVALLAEYHDRKWAFRFAEALMPKIANGIDYQWNLRRARAENFELELHPTLIWGYTASQSPISYPARRPGQILRRIRCKLPSSTASASTSSRNSHTICVPLHAGAGMKGSMSLSSTPKWMKASKPVLIWLEIRGGVRETK
jgi:high affinity Mn2+ porin